MSLFPAYIEDEEILEELQEAEIPKEFGIDFTTGQLTGKIVEGVEAVKVWCYLALRVARYRFFICSWDYGNEIEDLYGQGFSAEHIESEAARMIRECLLENDYIEDVDVSDIEYKKGRLRAVVTIETIYGDRESDTYETEVD
ncbi:MAG: DUF2634 domain-containing protein [Lachnospiraceae bacterium]|nr:DUF2634 domain-containing protein [Lachnospiraceae bacterium]